MRKEPGNSDAGEAYGGIEAMKGEHRHGHGAGHHMHPPHGWYYFGPEPPWAQAPAEGRHGPVDARYGATDSHGRSDDTGHDNADLMAAFDKMSRGELSAETLGTLFSLNDRDFWKGALVGSAVVLALSNLPALKELFAKLAASTSGTGAQTGAGRPPAAGEENSEESAP